MIEVMKESMEDVGQREMHVYGMKGFFFFTPLPGSSWGPATSSPDWELHSTGTLSVYSSMDTVKGSQLKSLNNEGQTIKQQEIK